MAFFDSKLEFTPSTVAASGEGSATTNSTNVIDLGSSPTLTSLGVDTLYFAIYIGEQYAAEAEPPAEVSWQLVSSSASDLSTVTVHWNSGVMAVDAASRGFLCVIPLPVKANYQRYLGVQAIQTDACTAGGWRAWLSPTPIDGATIYPDGI